MIKIYEDIKTVVVIGNESHSNIYNFCHDWLNSTDGITTQMFIVISSENNNLTFINDWRLMFRKKLL